MRLGHYQCYCHSGDFEANLATLRAGLAQGAERGLELMSFPEAFLAGYWRSEALCRENAWPLDSLQTREVLARTAEFPQMFIVGFNEQRGDDLYDTAMVIERGKLVGTYSKAFPAMPYFKGSRLTPVFHKGDVCFGVVICADGGYIEPTRILAMKGAQIVFAPHYNYIGLDTCIDHYVVVRHDHVARATENGIYFVRANNVERGFQASLELPGVGYGDSYILDPNGQVVVAAGLHAETLIWADIDFARKHYGGGRNRTMVAAKAFWEQLRDLSGEG